MLTVEFIDPSLIFVIIIDIIYLLKNVFEASMEMKEVSPYFCRSFSIIL